MIDYGWLDEHCSLSREFIHFYSDANSSFLALSPFSRTRSLILSHVLVANWIRAHFWHCHKFALEPVRLFGSSRARCSRTIVKSFKSLFGSDAVRMLRFNELLAQICYCRQQSCATDYGRLCVVTAASRRTAETNKELQTRSCITGVFDIFK